MVDKERDAVTTLLMMNAFQYLVLGQEPNNDALEIDFPYVLHAVQPYLESADAVCALAVMGRCMNNIESGSPAARAHIDHPELYRRLEATFLSNDHIRNFLSVIADAYEGDGDLSIKNFLTTKGAYVVSSYGKDIARRSISNTPRKCGFWSSLFG